jgi:hypothetical protein
VRPPLARCLFALLLALLLRAPLAEAQDIDPDAAAPRDTALDAVPALNQPQQQPQSTLPPSKGAKQAAFTWPVAVFSAGAAADWTSTAWSLRHPTSREDNPLIAWAKAPAAIIATGAVIDAVGAYAWMKSTTNHRRLQAVGLVVAAAFRGYLVVHNIRTSSAAGRPAR